MFQATKEQIEEWKAKHGDIFHITVGEHSCYLRKPDRKTVSYATTAGKTDPLKGTEVLLKGMWLDGDTEIQTEPGELIGVGQKLDAIIDIKEAELEKL